MNFHRSKYLFKYPILTNNKISRLYSDLSEKKSCYPAANPNPQNLPVLPVPKLHFTIQKLIKSAEPFVTPGQLQSFKHNCHRFMKCEATRMQRYIIEKAIRSHNWVDEWYRKCAFLRKRDSLPMSSSPVLLFPVRNFKTNAEQIDYTAKLILAVLKFRDLSRNKQLPLEIWKKYPLDMSVYEKMFTNTRVPKLKCDELLVNQDSQHIIVIFRNNIFQVKVSNEEGKPLCFKQLTKTLQDIVKNSPSKGSPFGILTSHKRDEWARIYKHMQTSANDARCLEIIEKALFAVCIDESPYCNNFSIEKRKLHGCENGFNGHGPRMNGANRWHDKTLQFFVDQDGTSGIIFEHSSVDASTLEKFADFVVEYVNEKEWMNITSIDLGENASQLKFATSKDLQCSFQDASDCLEEKMKNFSCKLSIFENCGKDLWTIQKLSPDGIIQASLQFAHFKTHGQFAAQQETGITRKFHLGRNDIIRSFTPEVRSFIECTIKPTKVRDKLNALHRAVKRHNKISEDVMDGKGIDCHLFGIMMACRETEKHLPKLFQETAFLKCSKFKIVSSQALMKENCFLCYPPVWGGGYNICYNPRAKNINICVTTRKDDPSINPKLFLDNWNSCMKTIFDMLSRY